jgi:hypothetical protein
VVAGCFPRIAYITAKNPGGLGGKHEQTNLVRQAFLETPEIRLEH